MATIRPIQLTVLLALLAISLYPPYSADAEEDHLDIVYDQLIWDVGYYDDLRYTFVHFIFGKLDDDGEDAWTFTLSRRTDYVVSGACDNDCNDLDLRLKTSSGTVVDRDEEPGYWPEVSVTPSRSQTYTVEVEMYDCDVDPCYYGIALFEK